MAAEIAGIAHSMKAGTTGRQILGCKQNIFIAIMTQNSGTNSYTYTIESHFYSTGSVLAHYNYHREIHMKNTN